MGGGEGGVVVHIQILDIACYELWRQAVTRLEKSHVNKFQDSLLCHEWTIVPVLRHLNSSSLSWTPQLGAADAEIKVPSGD